MRWMLNATAAVNTGTHAGEALQKRFRSLARELQSLCPASETNNGPQIQTPRSQAEFEALMKSQ